MRFKLQKRGHLEIQAVLLILELCLFFSSASRSAIALYPSLNCFTSANIHRENPAKSGNSAVSAVGVIHLILAAARSWSISAEASDVPIPAIELRRLRGAVVVLMMWTYRTFGMWHNDSDHAGGASDPTIIHRRDRRLACIRWFKEAAARRRGADGPIGSASAMAFLHSRVAPSTVLLTAADFCGPLRLASPADAFSGGPAHGTPFPQF